MKKTITIFTVLVASLILLSGCEEIATWKLVSGTLPVADPTPIVFEGDTVLNGWGVKVSDYTGTPELHFHVAPDSLKNLPSEFNFAKYDWNFKLENANEEFIQALGKTSQRETSEVLVDKITIVQEGHPLLHLTEAPGNSTSPQTQ
ncbi:MAG: hypothetical protein WCX95_00080 [Candidatus Gracilibacteria bacterium]